MNIFVFDDYTLMYDNDVIIETVFVRFDLPKVDNTYYCCDYKLVSSCIVRYVNYFILIFSYCTHFSQTLLTHTSHTPTTEILLDNSLHIHFKRRTLSGPINQTLIHLTSLCQMLIFNYKRTYQRLENLVT